MTSFCKTLQRTCRTGWLFALCTLVLTAFADVAYAQRQSVSGKVVDAQGAPVVGAAVIETGTANGASTGVDGEFVLELRGGGEFRRGAVPRLCVADRRRNG